jgi:hypothetical protein
MAFTPPTNPEDSYALSPFGFGPFPLPGESVDVAPPHPVGGGYGGVGFLSAGDLPDNGSPYGLGSYGSRWFSRPKVNISGGYGGDPYGLGGYGSTEVTPPYIASAISLDGFTIEIFFSEEVDTTNPALTDPTSYTLEPITGAAPATVLSVHIEKLGSLNLAVGDTIVGAISVVITHTGTTQGGMYKAHATGLTDIAGNPIIDADAPFLAKGEPPTFVVSLPAPDAGNELLVTFSHPMLQNAGGFPAMGSYDFAVATSNPYPIDLVPTSIVVVSPTQVRLGVKGMTSLNYDLTVSEAFAFAFDTTLGLRNCTTFDGGLGTITGSPGYLVFSRPNTSPGFAREWRDTSGTITPLTSTLRADCTFDFSNAAYEPAIALFPAPEIGEILFQDGVPGNGLFIKVMLQQSITGVEQVRLRSGTFDMTVDAIWSDAVHTISFVRNMQAGIVTFLLDEQPLTSTAIANVDAPAETQASVRFGIYPGGWDISGVRLHSVQITSSTTVFSSAWNFLHGQIGQFLGSSVLTRDRLLTQRGPLVKGWGDATPATEADVAVIINGTAVSIADVNPYIGGIVMAVPVPLLPLGDPQSSVAVDYKWFKSPVMELAGLNTLGLVLNKFDCARRGHHDPAAHGDQVQVLPGQPDFMANPGEPKGAVDIHRFPMSVVLGPMSRSEPLYIGHRYMGFERAYSALTNSPTTLLLNQAPGRVSVPGFEREVAGVSVAYEGLVKPVDAAPAWALDGVDYGAVDHDADAGIDLGTYTIIDPIVGDAGPTETATVYHRGLDLTYPSSVNLVARFQTAATALFDTDHAAPSPAPIGMVTVPTADGVFTGVGFGIHDNRHLYFCGVLLINGVEHIGLLLNPKRIHEWESWAIGPKSILTASSQSRGAFPSSQVPTGFKVGSKFQRLTGTQVGVYTATSVVVQSDGTTTVDFTPELPSPWDIYGNKYTEVVFETRASLKPFTYRLDLDTDQQVAELRISGETRGVVTRIDGNVPPVPVAAQTSLLLPEEIVGQVFWGSLSRQAASRATWSFMRYGLVPDQVFIQGHAVVNNTEMSDLPEDNPAAGGGQWWPLQTFGTAEILPNVDTLLLKATSASSVYDLNYGYVRVEPFFTPDAIFDYRAGIQLDSTTIGAGGAELLLDDTQRQTVVRSLMVLENLSADPTAYRGLVSLPQVSHTGLFPTSEMGWAVEAGATVVETHEGAQMVVVQNATQRGRWTNNIVFDATDPSIVDADEGRVFEARLEVKSRTTNANGDSGIVFGGQVQGAGPVFAYIRVELAGAVGSEVVRLRTATGVPIGEYTFDWTGEAHTFRLLANRVADTVTLLIDDVVQTPSVAFTAFSGGTNNTQAFFGCTGRDAADVFDTALTATVEWHHVHVHVQAPAGVVRTIGVLRGVTANAYSQDINDYELPRTDASTAPNSWATGPVIEWWDWRQPIELRVYRDPGWGVTVFRPDLPLPPFYQPEDGTAGVGFITESNEPSAGWINVEYKNLPPTQGEQLGFVGFGSLIPDDISQARWDWVRYRMFKHPTEDRIAPEHMVLNQFNVITSGERTQDVTLESVIVQTMDKTRLSLLPTHLYAESIYKIIDGVTIWTREFWTFDPASQLVTLQPDPLTGAAREFSAEHANVTVMFTPGLPVTNTYLTGQPLLDGVTLLNEGTPPIPMSQTAESEIETVYGSHLNDPEDVLNDDPDFVLNDPHRTIRHNDVDGSLYEALEFIEVNNSGQTDLIAAICERGPGTGFSGHSPTEGEDIYSKTGGGAALGGVGGVADHFATGTKVGMAVGAEVFDFSGTMFWHDTAFLPQPDWQQKGGMPGGILFASGGNFVNPVVDALGNIIPGAVVAGGGNLGPGTAVLFPTFPARGPVGGDQGRIYQRTDWYMSLRSVLATGPGGSAGSAGSAGGGAVETPLDEDWTASGWDTDAPSGPDTQVVNPTGVTNPLGAAIGFLLGAGDYSRYGPWGGLGALSASKDSGSFVFLVTLVEDDRIMLWDRTTLTRHGFRAKAVPTNPDHHFQRGPNEHIALANAINGSTIGDDYFAVAGLSLSGQLSVTVYTLAPALPNSNPDTAVIGTNTPNIILADTLPTENPTPAGWTYGVPWGGSGLQQSSLLAGGVQTIDHLNAYDARLGIVANGGQVLPLGARVKLIFQPA